jgi:hypothetical protein
MAAVPQDAVRDALRPLLDHPERWTLHVPMYLNTFCFAYHLASYLSQRGMTPKELDFQFVNDEWWRGHPTFMYRTDIEIFVAVEEMVQKLASQGHKILERIPFTKYSQAHVFFRLGPRGAGEPIIVTDVPQTVAIMKKQWGASPPSWVQQWSIKDIAGLDVRQAWSRTISDLFDRRPKIYAVSAPMTQILLARSTGSQKKYEATGAQTQPIQTFYVLRCNPGVPPQHVKALADGISDYYRLVLNPKFNNSLIDDKLADAYARLAMTGGQPNPFPEVYPGSDQAPGVANGELGRRYAAILDRHHVP